VKSYILRWYYYTLLQDIYLVLIRFLIQWGPRLDKNISTHVLPHSAMINQIDVRAVGNDVSRAFGVGVRLIYYNIRFSCLLRRY